MPDLAKPSQTMEQRTYTVAMYLKEEQECSEESLAMDLKGAEQEISEDNLRMYAGDCDGHLHQTCPSTTYEFPACSKDCNCTCNNPNLCSLYGCPGMNQTCQNPQPCFQNSPQCCQNQPQCYQNPAQCCQNQPQWQYSTQCQDTQWQNAPCNVIQPSQGCGSCAPAAPADYMEYRGFHHNPKPNANVCAPTDYSLFSQVTQSACSSTILAPPNRRHSHHSFACEKNSLDGIYCQKPSRNHCCNDRALSRRLSVERCTTKNTNYCCDDRTLSRRMSAERCKKYKYNGLDRCYYNRKLTPVARSCDVRQRARCHPHGSCAVSPKRSCSPAPCQRPRPRHRSKSCTRRRSICSIPSDCVEYNRSVIDCRRNPLVRGNSCYSVQRVNSKRCCRKHVSPCSYEHAPTCRRRPRSPSCRKPRFCSNETLNEQPVKIYRFSCPENRTVVLCPHCHRSIGRRNRSCSPHRRCASGSSRKSGCKCGPQTKESPVSSNRCIYKTLSRNLPRPKSSKFEAKYELTVCCKQLRCKGGADNNNQQQHHHNHHKHHQHQHQHQHHQTATVATSLKRTQKYISPTRMSFSSGSQSPTRYSSPRPSSSMPAHYMSGHGSQRYSIPSSSNSYQSRTRTASELRSSRSAAPAPAQKRNQSEHMGRDPGKSSAPQLASQMPVQMSKQMATPQMSLSQSPDPQPHMNRTPGGEIPSSSKNSHRSQHSKKNEEVPQMLEEQFYQVEPYPSSQLASGSPGIAPDHQVSYPCGTGNTEMVASSNKRKAANFLGTKMNLFYKGNFMNQQCVVEGHPYNYGPGQPGSQEFADPSSLNMSSMMTMPKLSGLDRLQSWVFGEPYVGHQDFPRSSAWTWRQIFGIKKRRQPRLEEAPSQ